MIVRDLIEEILRKVLADYLDERYDGPLPIERPAEDKRGDYATTVAFVLAKKLQKKPDVIAEDLVKLLAQMAGDIKVKFGKHKFEACDLIAEFSAEGPFINLSLSREFLSAYIGDVLKAGDDLKIAKPAKKEGPIVVEYSSINIGKPMTIGHLRSTVNGDAIANLLEATGHEVVRVNYLGDWGTQFGKLIAGYKKWGDDDKLASEPTSEMLRVYVKFHDELKKNPDLVEEGRAWFKKLEQGDDEATRIWEQFRNATLEAANEIYDMLDVKFDEITGESQYRDRLQENLDMLSAKGLLSKSEGAQIVDLENENLPPLLMQKKDDSSLYASREIAAAKDRYQRLGFSKMLYEVGIEQELHFRQIFTVLKKSDLEWAESLEHIKHGLYSLAGKKISSRKGDVADMKELMLESVRRAAKVIAEKNPELPNRDEVAKQVGIGAVKYHDLSQNRLTNIKFDFDRMLSLEGNSAPYLQYTNARIMSILEKAGLNEHQVAKKTPKLISFTEPEEIILARKLTHLPEVIVEAADKRMPHLLATELFELASKFNLFYGKVPVLMSDGETMQARLSLSLAVAHSLKFGLGLLGIKTPKKM